MVVKSLERHLRKIDRLMGATILCDGCVAPNVDVACLANMNLYALEAAFWSRGARAIFSNSDIQPKRGETQSCNGLRISAQCRA